MRNEYYLNILKSRGVLEEIVSIANMAGQMENAGEIYVQDDTELTDWIVYAWLRWERLSNETEIETSFFDYFPDQLRQDFATSEQQGGNLV